MYKYVYAGRVFCYYLNRGHVNKSINMNNYVLLLLKKNLLDFYTRCRDRGSGNIWGIRANLGFLEAAGIFGISLTNLDILIII